MPNDANRHWPPNTPDNIHLRILYQQFYSLLDQHTETVSRLKKSEAELKTIKAKNSGAFPRGSGPIDSVLLGVPVKPIDSQSLADGTSLKFNKAQGIFEFK